MQEGSQLASKLNEGLQSHILTCLEYSNKQERTPQLLGTLGVNTHLSLISRIR